MATQTSEQKMAVDDEEKKETEAIDANVCTPAFPQRLPQTLLTLVLHFLPLPDKLTQLTRIHRSFPPLTSAAFGFDSLTLTLPLEAAWLSSPRLRQLLSSVPVVLHLQADTKLDLKKLLWRDVAATVEAGRGEDTERQQPADFSATSAASSTSSTATAASTATSIPTVFSFPRAQQMSFCVEPPDAVSSNVNGLESVLPALWNARQTGSAALAHYAHLHSLHIAEANCRGEWWQWHIEKPFLAPLRSLPNLRTLRLTIEPNEFNHLGFIDSAALRLLVSLPLTHLDLSAYTLHVVDDGGVDEAELAHAWVDVTSTWKVLRLPAIRFQQEMRAAMLDSLLTHYMIKDEAAANNSTSRRGELEYIQLNYVESADELECLSRLSTLKSIQINTDQPFVDLSPLFETPPYSESGSDEMSPPLPVLRHLSFICQAGGNRDGDDVQDDIDVDNIAQQYVELVHCYSATLVYLELRGLLVFVSCSPILQAVFSCGELRKCYLQTTADVVDPAALRPSSLSLPPLPHLHTLLLDLQLSAAELTAVLSACPAVEDLVVRGKTHTRGDPIRPLQMLELVGRATRRVRSLSIKPRAAVAEETTDDSSAAASATSAPSSSSFSNAAPLFAELAYLRIGTALPGEGAVTWTDSASRMLVNLLHAAPLHYLELSNVPIYHVHPLSSLSHLRRLLLHDSSMPTSYQRFFKARRWDVAHSSRQRVSREEADELVRGGLISDERVPEWRFARRVSATLQSSNGELFETERIFDVGRDGREAFFEAVLQMLDKRKKKNKESKARKQKQKAKRSVLSMSAAGSESRPVAQRTVAEKK